MAALVSSILRYCQWMLPGMAAALILYVCLVPWRSRRLFSLGLRSSSLREGAQLLLWLFAGGLAVLTLCPEPRWLWLGLRYGEWSPFFGGWAFPLRYRVNLIPFSQGDSLFNLFGNVIMFLPFGFFAGLLWRGWTWLRVACLGFGLTLGIECWQIVAGRFFDVDDLILNTLGVLAGYGLYRLLRLAVPGFTARFQVAEAAI